MALSERSERNLVGVKPALVAVVRRAHELAEAVIEENGDVSFIVTEGLRDKTRQAKLFKAGASRTMNSKHLTGDAVDLAATLSGDVAWDWPLYHVLARYMKEAAAQLGVAIEWGGDWKGDFKDGPHFQLSVERKKA